MIEVRLNGRALDEGGITLDMDKFRAHVERAVLEYPNYPEKYEVLEQENARLEAENQSLKNDVLALSKIIDEAAEKMRCRLSSRRRSRTAFTKAVEDNRASNITCQVSAFHRKFNQPIRNEPTFPPLDEVRSRARYMTEEFFEVVEALYGGDRTLVKECKAKLLNFYGYAMPRVDIVELADGLGDLDYVVEGTRLQFGIPRVAVAAAIQETNMAKEGVDETGKVRKPEGWKPPDIEGILKAHSISWPGETAHYIG